MKKLICLALTLAMIVSLLAIGGVSAFAVGEEIPSEDVSVTWEDSRVYDDLTLGRWHTIPTYGVKGYEDVPFLRVSDYLDILYNGRQRISMEDGVMTVSVNGTEAVIDSLADTIVFPNTAKLCSVGDIDRAVVEEEEFNVITFSTKNPSTQTEVQPMTVNLKDYHMPAIAYDGDILLPFLALQNTFGSFGRENGLAYNGRDYYNIYEAESALLEDGTVDHSGPYLHAAYHGPFYGVTETTQAFADYGYYSICLLLDLTFGHKEELDITTFDEYFTRLNAKPAMTSTDPTSALMAEMLLFYYLFDSGHDALFSFDTVFGEFEISEEDQVEGVVDQIKDSPEGGKLFDEEGTQDPDTQKAQEKVQQQVDVILGVLMEQGLKIPQAVPILGWSEIMDKAKPENYGEQRLDYAGDTAVIYFESFKDDSDRSPSYYVDPIKEEDSKDSSFAFFYNCFEDIKNHDEVKNVVINLANNGGGSAAGLVSILGFLSEDGEVKITDRDLAAENYRVEYYHVDTNLDGVADDQDGFGGKYNFYILCSGSSYSCGNALPYFAQQQGLATIIGSNPGGGDCVVGSFVDAYGRGASYSSHLKLGTETEEGFVSDEDAVQVDLNMMPSLLDIKAVPWYDAEAIADAVHRYQNGETEIAYQNDEERGEAIGDLITALFGAFSDDDEEQAA